MSLGRKKQTGAGDDHGAGDADADDAPKNPVGVASTALRSSERRSRRAGPASMSAAAAARRFTPRRRSKANLKFS